MTSATSSSSRRIAHVADLHIGASYVHGDEDKGGVNSRLTDFRDAWVRSCKQMVEEAIDLVLFAGDAFRDCKPTPTEEASFRAGLDLLAEADIPVVMITGNHDLPRQVGRTHALAIFDKYENVTVVDRPQVLYGQVPGLRHLVVPVPVACFPYVSRAHLAARDPEFESLTIDEQNERIRELSLQVLRGLSAECEKHNSLFGSILVAHGTIAGSAIGAEQTTAFLREAVLPLSELRGLGFAYQAWGHLHRSQVLEPHVRYAGSIERCDLAEADEDKGFYLVELTTDPLQPALCEWVSSHPRPFIDINVPVDVPEPANWIESVCHDCSGAVVRVKYTATPEVARTVDHAAIRRALYAAGAAKVHGPIATITHSVTEASDALTEEADILSAWTEYAKLQGLDGPQFDRLDRKVREALEVCNA
jgi:exonuclease SbcD